MATKDEITNLDGKKCLVNFINSPSIPPDVYYAVTIQKDGINGLFYRFEGPNGDECHGWKKLDSFLITPLI